MILFAGCQKEISWPFYVTTYAGGKESGWLTGDRDSVFFAEPDNLAIDGDGNLFVSDRESHLVRKIIRGGSVVVVAGLNRGFADGLTTNARFNAPRGLGVDGKGNIYVADRFNHSIRIINADGYVSTLAGDGTAGFAEGEGSSAQFNNPIGIAVDAQGNVYVADSKNNRIRKVDPDGTVSTLAGSKNGFADGAGTAALFNYPADVAIDAAGNLYVADLGNNRIRKITPAGAVSTLAGSGTFGFADGKGDTVRFNGPEGIAADRHGVVYVADAENNRIRKITPDGVVSTIAGNGTAGFDDGPGNAAQFSRPGGLAVDAKGDFLFVADRDNRRIRKIDLR